MKEKEKEATKKKKTGTKKTANTKAKTKTSAAKKAAPKKAVKKKTTTKKQTPKKKTVKKTKKKKQSKNNNLVINIIINKIKDIIKLDKDRVLMSFILETVYIILIEILTKVLLGTFSFSWPLLRIVISSIMISGLITLIGNNLSNIFRKIFYILFNLFIVFYAWMQIGFIGFLGAFMSLGNASQGTKVTNYIADFLNSYKWTTHLIYIPFILISLYYIFEKKLTNKGYLAKYKYNKYNLLTVLFGYLILGGLYYGTITFGFMQNKYQTISNKKLFKYPSNPSIAIKNYGTSVYFLLDVKGTLFGEPDETYIEYLSNTGFKSSSREIDDTKFEALIDEEKNVTYNTLNKFFINRDIPDTNEYTGIFEDKNLVMIMMESVSEAVFSDEFKEYYPTLNKLYNEGITGINNYSPKNNCATGESEMISQTSLYSIETTCTVNAYKNNGYKEALLSMLNKNGYYTSTYHNFTDHYYYRSIYEYNLGAEKYYGVTDLGMTYSPLYKEWPSDLTMMEKAIPLFADKDKFASYMVTVTSHTPYMYSSTYGDMYLDLFEGLDLDIDTKRYLSKIKVVDLALEYLLDELDRRGILDDTVIVLFGDHYPYALSEDEYQSIANYDISKNQEMDRTPFIIYNSETPGDTITNITSPIDYTPTLLNMFGIEYDPRLYLGHDVFSDYDPYVVFPDNSWQSKEGFYSSSKGEFIPSGSGEDITDEKIIARNEEITKLRSMSTLAIRNNYMNYLFDYFENYDNNSSSALESKSNEKEGND